MVQFDKRVSSVQEVNQAERIAKLLGLSPETKLAFNVNDVRIEQATSENYIVYVTMFAVTDEVEALRILHGEPLTKEERHG